MTRAERNGRARSRARALAPLFAGLAAVVVLAAAISLVALRGASSPRVDADMLAAAQVPGLIAGGTSPSGTATPTSGVSIEMPDVVGKPVQVAEALLAGAGLTVQTRVGDVDAFGGTPEAVLQQTPFAGARVQAGSVATLVYQPRLGMAPDGKRFVVAIDPGHQATPDLTLEPDAPGSAVLKAKVSAGAYGIVSGASESTQVLAIALRVRDALRAVGVEVVMIRTSDNVNISNSERARVGNKAGADLVIRIHQGFSTDESDSGVTTLFPSGNRFATPIEPASREAAQMVQAAVVKASGARDRGVVGRSDLAGFNYSKVPTIMVECGYLSNRAEDARMATSAYRITLGNGVAAGVMAFLRSR